MSFEKSVKGATKIKNAPPKTKYIEHILIATHSGEAGVGEIFRALQHRLRDSTWTVVFKSLITVHLMIREGAPNVTLAYLANHRSLLSINSFTDAQTQGRNIRHYATYLAERTKAYRDTKIDWARGKEARLENLSVSKGLLRETEVVQHQLTALLKCDVMEDGADNEITIFVFRLMVLDLLTLFHCLNQGLINILRHFFEMSKTDAERAMEIYRVFTRQTDYVVQYLAMARQFAHHTRVEVPKLKHAPVNLGRQLEDYLKDPDFEINRRQFLAELEAKKANKTGTASKITETSPLGKPSKPAATATSNGAQARSESQNKASEPDLIDLIFDSIEQPQSPPTTAQGNGNAMYGVPQQFAPAMTGFPQQQNGFIPQQQTGFGFQGQPQSQPFGQQQMAPQQQQQQPFATGGFGGFNGQQQGYHPGGLGTIPQDSVASFQTGSSFGMSQPQPQPQQQQAQPQQSLLQPQATGTNPFRQSMLPQNTGLMPGNQTVNRTSTNPFMRATPTGPQAQPQQQFGSNQPFQSPQASRPTTAPGHLQPAPTGNNPFMRGFPQQMPPTQEPLPPQTANPSLLPQATGTNPFRQAFGGGGGWGGQGQGSMLDAMDTMPVFPRAEGQQIQGQTMWQQ